MRANICDKVKICPGSRQNGPGMMMVMPMNLPSKEEIELNQRMFEKAGMTGGGGSMRRTRDGREIVHVELRFDGVQG
jgi:hypothetical protein